jgi:ribonuclease BN (tRNA processing enzyme)
MKNTYLKFIGTGRAFNTKLGCTSAYIKYDDTLLLIDCGGPIYEKLINSDILNDKIKEVNIFITHTHPDHCGSLGTAIFYCKYTLGIQVKLFCTNRKIEDMLTIQMVPNNIYDFVQMKCDIPVFIGNREFNGPIKIIPIETKHVKDPLIKNPVSSGFLIKVL